MSLTLTHSRSLARKRPLRWFCAYRWQVGIRRRLHPLINDGDLENFTFLDAPDGHFYADPFIFEYEGHIFLFFEDYDFLERAASLACAELDEDHNILQVRTILRKPYHLSYPHVFWFDGSYFMIPETASVNRVELYRAITFPWEWRPEKILLNGVKYQDVTLLQHAGRHWIFAGAASTGASGNYDQLHLFHADTIFDRLIPHAANPVKVDLRSSRPAGAIIRDGDRLIRPAQDCSRWYGSGMRFMEIDVIDETRYSERPLIALAASGRESSNLGTHTYNASEHFEVIDVCSYGVEISAVLGRARSLVHHARV